MALLEVKNLTFGYNSKSVLNGISFSVEEGEFVGILGPNGCGKTTLLRAISNFVGVKKAEIYINGKDVTNLKRKEIARIVSFVPQLSEPAAGFSVYETVFMGRIPYLKNLSPASKNDLEAVENALKKTGLHSFKDQDVSSLSGGQYQRVLIARALAQETQILLLDEPTAHLDIRYQVEIMDLIKNLSNKTVIASFHDLVLAKKFCNRIIIIDGGRIVADGTPDEALSKQT
ncbi:MAG: ABC transporter ATP-binding protein, partial [Candidatus Margulisiibacteriota bacterium]